MACGIDLIDQRCQSDHVRVRVLSSFFFTKLREAGHEGVRRWLHRAGINLCDLDRLLFPVNVHGNHWVLFDVNLRDQNIGVYDSLQGTYRDEVTRVRKFVRTELAAVWSAKNVDKHDCSARFSRSEWAVEYPSDIPTQDNDSDCGVFTCFYADYLAAGRAWDFGASSSANMRRHITLRLL